MHTLTWNDAESKENAAAAKNNASQVSHVVLMNDKPIKRVFFALRALLLMLTKTMSNRICFVLITLHTFFIAETKMDIKIA